MSDELEAIPIETIDGLPVGRVTVEDVRTKDPWERQPEETGASFKAFVLYRDMGPDRSVNAVAIQLKGKGYETRNKRGDRGQIAAQYSKYQKWSKKYNWELRALAYDKMVDQQKIQAGVEAARKMTERHIGIGIMMQAKGVKRIKELTDEQVAKLKIPEAIKMINQGVDIELLARGLPTSNVSQRVTGKIEHRDDGRVLDAVNHTREVLEQRLKDMERKKNNAAQLLSHHKKTEDEKEEKPESVNAIRKELLPHLHSLEDLRKN